jgi:hypothetical protein
MVPLKGRFLSIIRNKFILTGLVFLVWMLLFDSNNLVDRIRDLRYLRSLENDRVYYRDKIRTDSLKLRELRTDNENLEKFAREQYLMKKPDEEIFLVIRKEKR